MSAPVTASMLYDLVKCPHRVSMDLFTAPGERDPANEFVRLLWERGSLFEKETMAGLRIPFLDLSRHPGDEKERLTGEAMARGEILIYGGRIRAGDLLGDPDLLRREGNGYVPGDIKSGAGEEGDEDEGKLKKHYAMQLALYVGILEQRGCSSSRKGFIWDVHGQEIPYDLMGTGGRQSGPSLWEEYEACLAQARDIVSRAGKTLPALASPCKLCHWHTACIKSLEAGDDLTLIPELGRSRRDALSGEFGTVKALAESDPERYIVGKKTRFTRIGPDTLRKFHRRARLQKEPGSGPFLTEPVDLPPSALELFFDIETDPMRDHCYLHGFLERRDGDEATERYIPFLAETPTPEAEREAFAAAWQYLQEAGDFRIYYYSPYERTYWRKLRERHPEVCSSDEVEHLFSGGRAVDLYTDVVRRVTEWPTRDYSIKTLAKHLGFRWRDAHPSGAASIEWFHTWTQSGDPAQRQRILDYNEDDCRATRVLLDGLRRLPVRA